MAQPLPHGLAVPTVESIEVDTGHKIQLGDLGTDCVYHNISITNTIEIDNNPADLRRGVIIDILLNI